MGTESDLEIKERRNKAFAVLLACDFRKRRMNISLRKIPKEKEEETINRVFYS